MSDLRDMGQDFVQDVEAQGESLESVNNQMELVHTNTRAAQEQVRQANERHQRSGKCLIWIAIIIVLCLGGLLGILFGTGVIG